MAFSFSPRIVTDGLVLYYDVANPRSYPGFGTTIYDLSRNGYNGTLNNGVSYNTTNGGALVFDGTDDYVQFAPNFYGPNIQTVCFWGRQSAGIPALAALVANSVPGDDSLRTVDGTFWYTGNSNDYHYGYSSRFMINGIDNLSQTVGGQFIIPNGRTLSQDHFIGAIGNKNLSTISHTFNGRVYKGNVYKVALYNRQLTSSELLQNFNAHKNIFGL